VAAIGETFVEPVRARSFPPDSAPPGRLRPQDVGEPTDIVTDTLAELSAGAGAGLDVVVKVTYFLASIAHLAAIPAAGDARLPHP
jgi:enamine deaminase RidA (YjgF/YER057c/UK114 family)